MKRLRESLSAPPRETEEFQHFPIIMLGASAGDIELVRMLLAALPADTGCAFVLIQGFASIPDSALGHTAMTAALLAQGARMAVIEATNGMVIKPNCFYVLAPQQVLSLQDGALRLGQHETPHEIHRAFANCLNALTAEYGPRAIGVILSASEGEDLASAQMGPADQISKLESENKALTAYNETCRAKIKTLEAAQEKLQALSQQLAITNAALEASLAQHDKSAHELHHILTSSDIATLFLDPQLKLCFFTPGIAPLFHLSPADIGRPLADLPISLSGADLVADALQVLAGQALIRRNVATAQNRWFRCSMTPYCAQKASIDGVVVTFSDISDLKTAYRQAKRASIRKSRFLAVTSHNLRQPVQALSLLLGTAKRQIEEEKTLALLSRAQTSLGVMSNMLNLLLDMSRLETSALPPTPASFPVNQIFDTMREEFAELMADKGLKWRVVPSSLIIYSDRALLSDMLRNLVANALRYTDSGSVLLGCRRRRGRVRIEVWDTGIGIAADKLPAIFDDYFRATDSPAEGSFGLGLSIAHQIGDLLGNPLNVRSWLGKGSVFFIDVPRVIDAPQTRAAKTGQAGKSGLIPPGLNERAAAVIYVVDEDRAARAALQALLEQAGYMVEAFAEAAAFLAVYQPGRTACMIADIQLPGMTGFEFLAQIGAVDAGLPTIVVTGQGDIAMAVQAIRAGAVDFLEKSAPPDALLAAVARALQQVAQQAARPAEGSASQQAAARRFAGLTNRERQVTQLVVNGHANKDIAAQLGISQRTVETHRASAMKKLGVDSISELVRLEMVAQGGGGG